MKYKTMKVVMFRRRSVHEASSQQYPALHCMGASGRLADDYARALAQREVPHEEITGRTAFDIYGHVRANGGSANITIKSGGTRTVHEHGLRLSFCIAEEAQA